MNIAQNNELIIPIIKVVAKPCTGPEPKIYNTIPVNRVVILLSIIADNACLYPSSIASLIPFPARISSRIRS